MSINQEISNNRSFLMGIAMLSIMLFHQGWIYGWNPFFAFFHFFGNWGVDIFFFVSGFGLYYSLNKDGNIASFYKRRLLRMLPICLVCGLFRYVIDHILPVGDGGYPTGVHEVSSNWMTILSWDRWFIPVIMVYYLLTPVLFCAIEKYGKSILWGVYFLALLGALSAIPGWMIIYTIHVPSFCIGAISAAGMFQLTKIKKSISYVAIIIALIYKFVGMMGWFSIDDDFTYIILSFGIVVLCLLIIRGSAIFKNTIKSIKNIGRIGSIVYEGVCYIGRHTLEIYLLHEFIYRYTYRFLIYTPIPLFFQMLVGILSSIIISILLSQLVGLLIMGAYQIYHVNLKKDNSFKCF